ncbi:MAG: 6-bladed beta-propeller, partial [Leptospira sp.]|nr:6-bladed beta-propeller [Leptospira sp.]
MRKPALLLFLFLSTQILSLDFPNFMLVEEPAKEEFKRGLVYKNLRQYSAAKERFQKAINLKKNFHLARYELAGTYYLLGEWEEALDELETLSSNVKNNLIIQNKMEALRLSIAGGTSGKERVFFKTIDGDEQRGYRFRNPTDIVFDDDNNSYVSAIGSSNIIKFNAEGTPISNFRGGITRKIEKPVSLAYYNHKLFSADYVRDEIQVFDEKGSFLYSIGGPGSELGKFRGPAGLCFDSSGNLYVSDSGNNRIQKFDEKGKFELEITGTGNDRIRNPSGLTFHDQLLYVIDKDNKRILVFDQDGNVTQRIQKQEWNKLRSIRILENQMYLSDEISGIWTYSLNLGEWKTIPNFRDKKGIYRILTRPFATNIDKTGNLYFVDYARHRIDLFTQKNLLYTNMDLKIESVDTSNFPDIHVYTRVRNRSGKDIIGIDRLGFRIYENDNMTPLFSLAKK